MTLKEKDERLLKKLNTKKGHTPAIIISAIGLVIAVGAGLLAINAQLHSAQTRTSAAQAVSAIENYAQQQLSAAVKREEISTKAQISPEEYSQNLEKDFQRMEEKYASGAAGQRDKVNDLGKGELPPLDQAIPGEMGEMNGPQNQTAFNFEEIIALAPPLILNNSTGGNAVGMAAVAVYQNQTFIKSAAINLPFLRAGEHYAVWLEDTDNQARAFAGFMNYEASTSQATLLAQIPGDYSSYKKLIIARQSPATESLGPIILSASYPVEENLLISPEDIAEFRNRPDLPAVENQPSAAEGSGSLPKETDLRGLLPGTGLPAENDLEMDKNLIAEILKGENSDMGGLGLEDFLGKGGDKNKFL